MATANTVRPLRNAANTSHPVKPVGPIFGRRKLAYIESGKSKEERKSVHEDMGRVRKKGEAVRKIAAA